MPCPTLVHQPENVAPFSPPLRRMMASPPSPNACVRRRLRARHEAVYHDVRRRPRRSRRCCASKFLLDTPDAVRGAWCHAQHADRQANASCRGDHWIGSLGRTLDSMCRRRSVGELFAVRINRAGIRIRHVVAGRRRAWAAPHASRFKEHPRRVHAEIIILGALGERMAFFRATLLSNAVRPSPRPGSCLNTCPSRYHWRRQGQIPAHAEVMSSPTPPLISCPGPGL